MQLRNKESLYQASNAHDFLWPDLDLPRSGRDNEQGDARGAPTGAAPLDRLRLAARPLDGARLSAPLAAHRELKKNVIFFQIFSSYFSV